MDDQKKTSTQNLLDADLDAIVVEGKRQSKRKAVIIVAAIMVVVAVGIIGFQGTREATYQEAISAFSSGDYESAISLFQGLADYKDSKQQMEKAEFLRSDVYAAVESLWTDNMKNVPNDGWAMEYNQEDQVVTLSLTMLEDTVESFGFATIEPSALAAWAGVCEAYQNLSQVTYEKFIDEGYSVSCTTILQDNTGTPLYSAINGETTYNCVGDMETAVADAQEKLYNHVVSLVEEKKYTKAYNYWNSNNPDYFYSLEYKDLTDYYYYADALRNYDENQAVSPSEYLASLNKVSEDFKDVAQRKEIWKTFHESVDGVFEKDYITDSILGGTVKLGILRATILGVENIKLEWIGNTTYPPYGEVVEYRYTTESGVKISWTMEDGQPVNGKAKYSAWSFKIKPVADGLQVNVYNNTDGKLDNVLSGTYIRQK